MSDSVQHHAPDHNRGEQRVDLDDDAKIENLLLAGLDCYFSARYEDAVHVWTRALFFDRGHVRARAYIERARRALAERQRESEELAQTGADAFRRGDIDAARTLLMSAIDRGGTQDDVQVLLERLGRLQAGPEPVTASFVARPRPRAQPAVRVDERAAPVARARRIAFGAPCLPSRWSSWHWSPRGRASGPCWACQARQHYRLRLRQHSRCRGHLGPQSRWLERRRSTTKDVSHEALSVLSRVRSSSTVRGGADALQTVIQRALVAGASLEER